MGNTDSIPVVSQTKSFVQWVGGDSAGALATQQNFAYNNTFPVISQIASAGYAIGGDSDRALDLQKKFAEDMENVIDSIPVAGHIKGGVHYAMGENQKGDEAMKSASRSTGVVLGGIGGFAAGGPAGAVAGGIAGGAAMDGIITGSEILINGQDAKPHGYVAMGQEIAKAVDGERKISVEQGFDMAMVPVSDGLAGYSAGKMASKPLGLNVGGGSKPIPAPVGGGGRGIRPPAPVQVIGEEGAASMAKNVNNPNANAIVKPNRMGLDKAALDNRANQLNPNHVPSGPGRPAAYPGAGDLADLNNHANQLNPNNPRFAPRPLIESNKV